MFPFGRSVVHRSITFAAVSLFAFLANAEPKTYRNIMGPYRIILKRMEKCPASLVTGNRLDFDIRDVRTKANQAPIYSGEIVLHFILNESISARATLASWSSMGGWKENAHVATGKHVCGFLTSVLKSIWHVYLRYVYGEIVPCYFYPGYYRFVNLTTSTHGLPIKNFFYGRWRADLQMLHSNGDVATCIRGYADTVAI